MPLPLIMAFLGWVIQPPQSLTASYAYALDSFLIFHNSMDNMNKYSNASKCEAALETEVSYYISYVYLFLAPAIVARIVATYNLFHTL